LDVVDPTYAVISAGLGNTYGHPHNETLQKLAAKGVTTYCTINSGTIIAQTDGTTITFPDNPQPIPEMPILHVAAFFVALTLVTVTVFRKKLQTTNKTINT
jgi:hypothetical protein